MLTLRHALMVMSCAILGLIFAGCAKVEIPAPHEAPLSQKTLMLLGKKKMEVSAPIFVRIFKAESELEVWKQREDGHFYHLKTYPICHWSGELGPKIREGDKQAPEGFYTVNRHQMNPNSSFHLSFDLGYPNAYDRAHGRTGNFLMVHGKCRSAGCYAMTDALIEEIYALARESFAGGQRAFHVHAFPFRLTQENLARYHGDKNTRFWQSLQQGYDYFEATRKIPNVEICARRYNVNVEWDGARLDPNGACPRFRQGPISPFVPLPTAVDGASQEERTRAPGPPPIVAPQPIAAPQVQPPKRASIRYHPPGDNRMSLAPLRPSVVPQDPIAAILRK